MFLDRGNLESANLKQFPYGQRQRDKATGDGGSASASVGLQDVAIDHDAAFAQSGEIDDSAQGTADQSLDFMRAPGGSPLGHLALRPRGGGARQHGVLRGDPAFAASPQEWRNTFFHGGC